MPRRREVPKRILPPDPLFQSVLVTKLINMIMRKGKKNTAEGLVYSAMRTVQAKTQEDPLKILKKAVDNLRPYLEVKSRRVGGATYQVPVEVKTTRRQSLALRWLIHYAQSRGGRTMKDKLANEIMDAFQNRGGAIKKKEDTHRMAEANKAFAHYRW
ncbi:MAG: 30S ribosomal protein S7 [Acidobacteria bacterium]|nr:30S ribosomal protein S7 [Acidobacteriota bacterium]